MLGILEVKELTFQYPGQKHKALDGISFSLDRGEILALLGPSGCGKTSLLRVVAGFERPQSGTIVLDHQILASPDRFIPPEQRHIGMVFQDYALFPHLTVEQNVGFGLRGNRSDKLIQEALERVGLAHLRRQFPHQLSGGQQQRVALARALITNPALVLLDEPLSNIDVQLRLNLRNELKAILQQTGTTALWVTHDQEEAMAVADWIGVIQAGKLEQWGTPADIYYHPCNAFVAQFVSQANLLPLKICDGKIITDLGEFPLNAPLTDQKYLSLRQEEAKLTIDADSPIVITDRFFLGREWVYQVKLPSGRTITARTASSEAPLTVGTKVTIGGKWELL
ncbi:MAG: ABC transporter ATP-binding protein [Cyanobacteria bacterium KgW148]|nr:ABC transporter ATP-binding protein [Cyanobacteria bacterium KgW148]